MKSRSLLTLTLITAIFLTLPLPSFAQEKSAAFILSPDKTTLSPGDTLELMIKLNTGEGNGINSYMAKLDYPENKLTFDSINTDSSPFNMALEAKGGDGQVSIIRGTATTQTGELLVGTVKFIAKSAANAREIKISSDSAIIRSSDNTNILPGSSVKNSPAVSTAQPTLRPQTFSYTFSSIFGKIVSFFNSLFQK